MYSYNPYGAYQQPQPVGTGVSPNVDYRIRSAINGTVLDDWGGKTGESSAALQPDNVPSSGNRAWRLIPCEGRPGWYRIRSSKGTVLDDWGGKTGENSAAFMPDDVPHSENRMFQVIPVLGHFVIRSSKGTVLDDWGGKTGENSAAFMPDDRHDYQNTNRLWDFVPLGQPYVAYQPYGTYQPQPGVSPSVDYRIRSAINRTVLDDWGGKTGESSAALQPDNVPSSGNRAWRLIPCEGRPGWYRIRSSKGTVLDDWGGKTGENSAAFMPDNVPQSENRMFQVIPVLGHFVIRSSKGTVLDDWGGKTGENSAAFMPDDRHDYQNTNRLWDFVPLGQP